MQAHSPRTDRPGEAVLGAFLRAAEELRRGLSQRFDVSTVWQPQESPVGPPHPQIEAYNTDVFELMYGGARGGGKTDTALARWLKHREKWRGLARGVFFRRRAIHLEEVIARTHALYPRTGGRWIGSPRAAWVWPDGSELKFRHLWDMKAAASYQGHAYTFICIEEAQQWPTPEPIDLLRATLRSAHGVDCELMLTGNPGGVGHHWVKARYITPARNGYERILDPQTGSERMFIPARLEDNPALMENDPSYERRLLASGSEALVRAWRWGDWDVTAGGFFSDVWDAGRQVLEPFPIPQTWTLVRSFDWGSDKPASLGLWAISSGEPLPPTLKVEGRVVDHPYPRKVFPKGSFIRIGELYTVERDPNGEAKPNVGQRLPNPELGAAVEEVSEDLLRSGLILNGGKPRQWQYGYADPSIWTEDGGKSIYRQMVEGTGHNWLGFKKADNARIAGWQKLRALLRESAKAVPEGPGLWVFKTCREWIRTVPVLPADERKLDDVDTAAEDHSGDETRYAIQTFTGGAQSQEFRI